MKVPFANPQRMLANSWVSDPDRVRRLDNEIRQRLLTIRKENALPAREPSNSVNRLVEHIRRGVRYRRWFVTTSSCALLGELIYGSQEGGIYKSKRHWPQREQIHDPLRALRNACCHPALVVGDKENAPAMEQLVAAMKKMPLYDGLARQLASNWTLLHGAPLTAWAIKQLDTAGKFDLGLLGRSVPRR